MKDAILLSLSFFTGVGLCVESRVRAADVSQTTAVKSSAVSDLPGSVVHSWLANSFATQKGQQSVPVTAIAIAVTPEGTVFSAGVAEGYGGVPSCKGQSTGTLRGSILNSKPRSRALFSLHDITP